MNIDHLLFWIPVLSCAAVLVRLVPLLRSGRGRGWAVVAGAILLEAGVGALFFPTSVAGVTVSLWALFVLAPSLLSRAVARFALAQDYERARRLCAVTGLLHPADGWRQQVRFYRAMALSQTGKTDEAAACLDELIADRTTPPIVAQGARIHVFRMRGQWEESIAWAEGCEAQGNERKRADIDANVIPIRLRALGETGRLHEMLTVYQAARARLEHLPLLWPYCQLYLFAFAGREAAIAAMLDGPLGGLSAASKVFWRATTQMAADQAEAGRTALRELAAGSSDGDLCRAVTRRLAHDLTVAEQVLSPAEMDLLAVIERESQRELPYQPRSGRGIRHAYATLVLIGLNLAMFALEMWRGDSQGTQTLFNLGAMWRPAVLLGHEWYRLVAAMFLHFGPVHLAMNLIALAVIGPWVEQGLGRVRYVAVYFATGIGSMLAVLGFMQWGWMPDEMLVGASSAIMGLIGAMGAMLTAGWRRDRSRLAARRLRGVVFIVAIQVVFDLLTPQVSFAAHAAGVVIGFLFTLILSALRTRRPA